MKIVAHGETHTVFETTNVNARWTLCVIDDFWFAAKDAFSDAGDSPDKAKLASFLNSLDFQDGADQGVVALLPEVCAKLPDLRRLVIGDFPRTEKQPWFLGELGGDQDTQTDRAFLIDVADDQTQEKLGDTIVIPFLLGARIAASRWAYFSYGGTGTHKIPLLLKAKIRAEILDWWDLMRGRISADSFKKGTEQTPHGARHDPSTLNDALKDESFFTQFLPEQIVSEAFGVWNWAARVIRSGADLPAKQYAYHCAKAFIKSGDRSVNPGPEDLPFSFAALRGLTRGLGWVMPETREINVVEEYEMELSGGIPKKFLGDMDNTLVLGRWSTGAVCFELFATCLRDWLQWLERDTKGSARVSQLTLREGKATNGLVLEFTGALPPQIFDGTGTGLVTRGWTALCKCFREDQQPAIGKGRQVIELRFERQE